jgi:RHS repeat-associated protein
VSEKKNGVITKRWVWAGGNQPAEERDAAGNVTRRFYPQGEQAGTTKSYYTKDHLGSIREVLGANGAVVSSSRYDAWGVRTTQGAQDAASFGFTGHLEHKELGLVFTLYRAYDPATGRWLSRDPIGENGGINLYGYVVNNPVNYVDPLGLINWSTIGSAFEGKIGVGLGLQAKVQVSKLKVSSGARYTLGSWGNLGGQVGNYITAEADLIKISAGEHQLGLGAAYNLKTQMDSDPDSCPTFTEKSGGVAGYKYGGVGSKSNDWFKVGASAKLGVVDIGGSINFGTIWQGLWE